MTKTKNNSGVVLCTLLMALMVLSVAVALTLRADTVYINGVKQAPASVSAAQVTNTIDYKLIGSVFGSTGITNVWAGSAADYITETNTPPGKGADPKTAYFIWE